MMPLQAGMLLQSTRLLQGTFFENTLLLITEIRHDGPIGFILNRPFERPLTHLLEFQHRAPLALYTGGPVEQEKLFILHQRPDLIQDAQHIINNLYWGGDFNALLNGIDNEQILPSEIKLLLGYCGWDHGQLENELKEGSWIVVPHADKVILG